jgi:hypothetical protein
MEIINISYYNNFKIIKEKDANRRDIKLYELHNVELTGISMYYPDILLKTESSLILPLNEMCMSLNKKTHYEENGMIFNYINKKTDNNYIDCVYYFIYDTSNYYHFIYDTLPYLYNYLNLRKENKKIKLLMTTPLLPFVKQCLELLDINDIIFHREGNIYRNLFVSNSMTHDGLSNSPPRKEIFEIYDKLVQNVYNVNVPVYDKVYISRRTWTQEENVNIGTDYTTRRKLVNEDQLVKKLNENGYKEIFGENYSMIEKIKLFNNAKVVIGAIGGTITNCIFCNKSCKIITLVSPTFLEVNKRMKFLFNENVKLFNDTELIYIPNTSLSANVRVELENKEIGEICDEFDEFYTINLNWKNKIPKLIYLKRDQFKTLDNGINSPWKVNISKLTDFI